MTQTESVQAPAPAPTRRRAVVGEVSTTTIHSKSGQILEEKTEASKPPQKTSATPKAMVGVEGSVTRNLGNFESLRVQVSITLPSECDDESVRDTFENAASMVDEFIQLEIQRACGQLQRGKR